MDSQKKVERVLTGALITTLFTSVIVYWEDDSTNEIDENLLLGINESLRASETHKGIITDAMALVDAHLSYAHKSITEEEWNSNKKYFESRFNMSLDEYNNSTNKTKILMSEVHHKMIWRGFFKYPRVFFDILTFILLLYALIFYIQKDYKEIMLEEIQADNRRLKDSMKVLEDLLSRDTVDTWRNKGFIFYSRGNYDESLNAYNKILEIDPLDSLAWMSKGDIFKRQGNYDKAILSYDKAIKLNPNSSLIWRKKGAALMIKGKLDNAIEAYNKSIEIDPSDSIAWDNRGWALSYLGKYNEAIQSFEKAIEIDPTDASAWCNSGKALKVVGRKKEADVAFATAKTLGYKC